MGQISPNGFQSIQCCMIWLCIYLNKISLTWLDLTWLTRYVDGTPTSEVTPVTIRYILPPHYGHTSQYHGQEWMTYILFVLCQLAVKLFQTLTLKFQLQSQGHGCGQRARSYNRPSIILTHFILNSHQSDYQFLRAISKFELETSKVKVISEVKGQGHILYPASNRCTSLSFHINRTNHSWDMSKIVFDLEKTHPNF